MTRAGSDAPVDESHSPARFLIDSFAKTTFNYYSPTWTQDDWHCLRFVSAPPHTVYALGILDIGLVVLSLALIEHIIKQVCRDTANMNMLRL